MPANTIMTDIALEVKRAKKKHPNWPVHMVTRAAIVSEEAGELLKAALEYDNECWGNPELQAAKIEEMRKEAVQVAAMAIRFLENLK